MEKTWTIILGNDDVTERNLSIAIDNLTWGTRTGGLHAEIKAGDNIAFLVGVRASNRDYMEKHAQFREHRYPMYPDDTITSDFISDFEFHIDRMILGKITSDYFIEEHRIWPSPHESDSKKSRVSYKHRFNWIPTHEAENLLWGLNDTNYNFHFSIIAAAKKRAPYPSQLTNQESEHLESKLSVFEVLSTDEQTYQNTIETARTISIPAGPVKPPTKRSEIGNAKGKWPRNYRFAKNAIVNANYKCEHKQEHITFKSRVTQQNFVEAHHLIPMEKQDEFDVSIDVPENILSLCPNCHSMFHHSDEEIIRPLLEDFLRQRKGALLERGIKITSRKLIDYYVKE